MGRVLIYSQDRGGAQILTRVTAQLLSTAGLPPIVVTAHPLSEPVFRAAGIETVPLAPHLPRLPAAEPEVECWLRTEQFTHVICTTSSRFVDMTNARLITAARRLGIPTLSFLDHWLGFDRFVDDRQVPLYMTDVIGCIDDYCARKMVELGMRPQFVAVVGHPHLEAIRDSAPRMSYSAGDPIHVLLVSQPSLRARSFRGLFHEPVNGRPFIDALCERLREAGAQTPPLIVRYRPHPKETIGGPLPDGIKMDSTPYSPSLFQDHHVFIGATSMLLIEASAAGRHTVRLALPQWAGAVPELTEEPTHHQTIRDLAGLRLAFAAVINRLQRGEPPQEVAGSYLDDALSRACALAVSFIEGRAQVGNGSGN